MVSFAWLVPTGSTGILPAQAGNRQDPPTPRLRRGRCLFSQCCRPMTWGQTWYTLQGVADIPVCVLKADKDRRIRQSPCLPRERSVNSAHLVSRPSSPPAKGNVTTWGQTWYGSLG
jgi:hypothetical protein